MKNRSTIIVCLTVVILFVTAFVNAQTQVEVKNVFKLPLSADSGILGMRVAAGKAFVVNAAGHFVRYDLETGEALKGRVPADNVIDFDISLGQLVYLDGDGRVGGRVRPSWPDQSYAACRIDAGSEGLLLSGGARAVFLGKNASAAFYIDDMVMLRPIENGYVWGVQVRDNRWHADLYDTFGNLMHEVYTFSEMFEPAGLELGPIGPDGELLISSVEDNARKLSLIASNGYMFWKMDGPTKLFPRDVAFDHAGNLLVLEAHGKDLWLTRWQVTHPEG